MYAISFAYGSLFDKLTNTEKEIIKNELILPGKAISKSVSQTAPARSLPDSVDKGDSGQRGIQLQTVSKENQTIFEFLHFLQAYSISDKPGAPKLEKTGTGLKISRAAGDKDLLDLQSEMRTLVQCRNNQALTRYQASSR